MPTLQELIAEALRAKNVGAVNADPYGKLQAEYDYASQPPEFIQAGLQRVPERVRPLAELLAPSRADILTMGASKVGRGLAKAAGVGGTVKDAILGTGALRMAQQPNWRKPRGVFDRDVPDLQGTVDPDPRMAGIFAKTPTQTKTGTERVSDLTALIADSPAVRRGIEADIEKGMWLGGPEWYNHAPLLSRLSPEALRRFTLVGGAASAQSPVNNELVSVGNILYGLKRGLTPEQTLDEFGQAIYGLEPGELTRLQQIIKEGTDKTGKLITPEAKAAAKYKESRKIKLPFLSKDKYTTAERALESGVLLPSELTSGAWKIPHYAGHRLGYGSLDPTMAGAFPALDTHEKTRLFQLAMGMDERNATRKAVLNLLRSQGADVQVAMKGEGIIPKVRVGGTYQMPELTNTNDDYRLLGNLYVDAAKKFGLPTAGAAQAARWLGGGTKTGLQSAPEGDLTQILEDLLMYSAQQRGMPDDPASLRRYFDRYASGDDFLVPYTGKGAPPIR